MSGGGSKVDIVVTGTGTNHNLQLLGGIEHLSIDLIRADDQCIGIFHSIKELCLLSIFLQKHQFITCCFNFCLNPIHSCCCERFLCCN